MVKRKQNEPPQNDFAPSENEEILGFTSESTIPGQCISSFSFDDDTTAENINVTNTKNNSSLESNNATSSISSNNKTDSTNDNNVSNAKILTDNRKTSIVNGMIHLLMANH